MSFGENLRRCRKERGFKSAKQFARVLGVEYSTYMGYENRRREPKYEVLTKIANVLDTTTDELLGRGSGGTNKINAYREVSEAEKHTVYKVIDVLVAEYDRAFKLSLEAKTGHEKEWWDRRIIEVTNCIAKVHDKFGLDV